MDCLRRFALVSACVAGTSLVFAQAPAPAPAPSRAALPLRMGRGPTPVVSPQIASDGRVTFRIFAPQAAAVTLGGDINQGLNRETGTPASTGPASAIGIPMTKGPDGVWSGTSALPMKPGAWRYHFMVDGMTVVDTSNVNTSPYQTRIESLLIVPGDFSETRDVPHGAVSKVRYAASTFDNAIREMVVYTPPGYEKGTQSYPVLYLIHGGGETAASW